uniref:Uncharacterized protein n=1 Tax=Romanomermis culicivorax TaxID=13658 RepID=A0A915KJS6_ROMCU
MEILIRVAGRLLLCAFFDQSAFENSGQIVANLIKFFQRTIILLSRRRSTYRQKKNRILQKI